jgi:hypothetical protein
VRLIVALLSSVPVWPPNTRTPIESDTPLVDSAPLLVRVLLLSSVAIAPEAVGVIAPSLVMVTSSAAPEAAVEVAIGVVRELLVTWVSADAPPAQSSRGARAAEARSLRDMNSLSGCRSCLERRHGWRMTPTYRRR